MWLYKLLLSINEIILSFLTFYNLDYISVYIICLIIILSYPTLFLNLIKSFKNTYNFYMFIVLKINNLK